MTTPSDEASDDLVHITPVELTTRLRDILGWLEKSEFEKERNVVIDTESEMSEGEADGA